MKIDITIKDATAEEAQNILSLLKSDITPIGKHTTAINIPNTVDCNTQANTATIDPALAAACAPAGQYIANTGVVIQPREDVAAETASGDLDARGFPWNEAIHSGNQSKTAKGVWNKKRGASDALIAEVEANMRSSGFGQVGAVAQQPVPQQFVQQAQVQPAQNYTPPLTNDPAMTLQYNPAQHAAPNFQQPFPVTNQAPAQQFAQQPAPQTNAPAQDYNGLMHHIGALFASQQANGDYLATVTNRISHAFGQHVASISDIGNNPAMVAKAWEILRADGKA